MGAHMHAYMQPVPINIHGVRDAVDIGDKLLCVRAINVKFTGSIAARKRIIRCPRVTRGKVTAQSHGGCAPVSSCRVKVEILAFNHNQRTTPEAYGIYFNWSFQLFAPFAASFSLSFNVQSERARFTLDDENLLTFAVHRKFMFIIGIQLRR